MKETDLKIRLVEFLLSLENRSLILSSEFRFSFGSRRADIVSLEENIASSYEIKSASDNTSRLGYQILSYRDYFDYCYVVCVDDNLQSIRAQLPRSIGIIVVSDSITKIVRKPTLNRKHNKIMLASTLPVKELKALINSKPNSSKYDLCLSLALENDLESIRKLSRQHLMKYSHERFRIFKTEIGEKITPDDILTITRMPSGELSRITP